MCRVVSCVVGRGCLLWPVCSLGKTLLTFALLHFVLQSQTCLLARYLFTSYFCISIPIMKGHLFWGVNSRKSCRSLYNCSASSALVVGTQTWITVIWVVCLVNKLRSFCHFWDCTQVLHFGLFCLNNSLHSKWRDGTKENNSQLWTWLVMEVKPDAVKNNIA